MPKLQLLFSCFLVILLASCQATDDWPDEPGVFYEGDVGIIFENGVECLGENAQPLEGDNIYVSPSGNDKNSGLSAEDALGTLAYAICNLEPGQTLNLMPGTYHESVILGAFGAPDQPITIQGTNLKDQGPILEGDSKRTMGIALVESTNFVVQNLTFQNYTDEGLQILESSHITIRNNRFIDNGRASIDPDADEEGFGLNVDGCSHILIEGNQALGNGPGEERWKDFVLGTGINTYEMTDSIIRDNFVSNTIGGGVLVEDGDNVLVENNRIENNELDANGDYWDGGIWVDGSTGVTLRGNIIRDNHGPGLNLSDEDVQYPDASTDYIIENNIITGNLFGVYVWNFGKCPAPDDAVRFLDNQIEDNLEQDIWCNTWVCGEGQPCE